MSFSRFAIFIIYFWFGALKVFSPHAAANPLVLALLAKTMPFFSPNLFLILFGIFEMIIGLCFLFPKLNRLALILFVLHMISVIMPLILVPEYTWQGFLMPTLEGQYIIKNLVLIALVINIFSEMDKSEAQKSYA